MHESAFEKAQLIRRAYLAPFEDAPLDVLDVGSAVVADGQNRSNREAFANPRWRYTGLDIEAGPNVDVVVAEPYDWREVPDGSFDVVCCSQVFEHTQFFWITILEIARRAAPERAGAHRRAGLGAAASLPGRLLALLRRRPARAGAMGRSRRGRGAGGNGAPVYRKGNQWRDARRAAAAPPRATRCVRRAPATRRASSRPRISAARPRSGVPRPCWSRARSAPAGAGCARARSERPACEPLRPAVRTKPLRRQPASARR